MGILDSKTRILDVIITQEGRRQISEGKLIIEHASFSDDSTFYRKDAVSGTMDASSRIFLEATSQRQDSISIEADDSGLLLPFPGTSGFDVINGGILSGTIGSREALTGSAFTSLANSVLAKSLQNFTELMPLATHDEIFDDSNFDVDTNIISFSITNESPLSDRSYWTVNINDIEALMEDQKFSHIENFMYLPPTSKRKEENVKGLVLANYARLTPKEYDIDRLENDLLTLQRKGLHQNVHFIQTSRRSRLLLQMFESDGAKIKKLDVYKFCNFIEEGSMGQSDVYFAGKLVPDQNGSFTFLHIFTLVFR